MQVRSVREHGTRADAAVNFASPENEESVKLGRAQVAVAVAKRPGFFDYYQPTDEVKRVYQVRFIPPRNTQTRDPSRELLLFSARQRNADGRVWQFGTQDQFAQRTRRQVLRRLPERVVCVC